MDNTSAPEICLPLPDAVRGATIQNITKYGDTWTIKYSCNDSHMWEGGSLVRHCHGVTGNWTGTPLICSYDDPTLRAELIGGIVGGVCLILLIVLSIDFVYQTKKKTKGRKRTKRLSQYEEHARPTSFFIKTTSYTPINYLDVNHGGAVFGQMKNDSTPEKHHPDVVSDVGKAKHKRKDQKGRGVHETDKSEMRRHVGKLEPIDQRGSIKEKKKKKKKQILPVPDEYTCDNKGFQEDPCLSNPVSSSITTETCSDPYGESAIQKSKKIKKKKKRVQAQIAELLQPGKEGSGSSPYPPPRKLPNTPQPMVNDRRSLPLNGRQQPIPRKKSHSYIQDRNPYEDVPNHYGYAGSPYDDGPYPSTSPRSPYDPGNQFIDPQTSHLPVVRPYIHASNNTPQLRDEYEVYQNKPYLEHLPLNHHDQYRIDNETVQRAAPRRLPPRPSIPHYGPIPEDHDNYVEVPDTSGTMW